MPPRCYGYENENEMLMARKYNDNKKKKLKYWREKYGLDIKDDQYEEFSKYSTKIKHIIPILPFLKNIETI
tara:strand:- start:2346 stop:2558 length:213 start_codon:yes stop_codon:yes gene_type:complete